MHALLYRSHASTALHRRSVPISWTADSGIFTGSLSYMAGPIMTGFEPVSRCTTITNGPMRAGTTELMTAEEICSGCIFASRNSVRRVEKYSSPVRLVSVKIRHSRTIFSFSKRAATIFVFPMSTASSIATFSLTWYYTDMETLIQPRVLKGFRDFLPAAEIERDDLTEKITKVYRSFGFVPIDTPVLEYSEILLRKSNGETEKQVFRFEDNGGRDVALRFDLTVPFARFIAEHKEELYFPFKRYHIAKVWRGEKPQAGRYREFVQCDFDIVGSDSASSDFEILSLMKAALKVIGVDKVTIHVNHRGIFNVFLKKLGLLDKSEDILRIVDKLGKIGEDGVKQELLELFNTVAATANTAEDIADFTVKQQQILDYINDTGSYDAVLDHISGLAGEEAAPYVQRMRDIHNMMVAAGIQSSFVLDPAITRGLDYYTGVVYETFLDDLPSIGSVCSGGRYQRNYKRKEQSNRC